MLFSMELTGILLIIFAVSAAVATFIENDHGSNAAKVLVYHAHWFEFLLLLTGTNLIGSIFARKLYSRSKLSIFVFHLAFIIILAGSAITRYFGFEGTMHIREGQSANSMSSSEQYLKVFIQDKDKEYYADKVVILSPVSKKNAKLTLKIDGDFIHVKALKLIPNAFERIYESPDGKAILSLIFLEHGIRNERALKEDEPMMIGELEFCFSNTMKAKDVTLNNTDTGLVLNSVYPVDFFNMMTNQEGTFAPDTPRPIEPMLIYRIKNLTFAANKLYPNAKTEFISADKNHSFDDVLQVQTELSGEAKEIFIKTKGENAGKAESINIGKYAVSVAYGANTIDLPFALKLNDFKLERYPGSQSPSSFISEVSLIDKEKGVEEERSIYMNNILNYRGYRFFQSSYDTDEMGTILSVNHDFWGTAISYLGYLIMTIGMVLSLLNKNSRLRSRMRLLGSKNSKIITLAIISLFMLNINAAKAENQNDQATYTPPSKEHAKEFGKLLIQDQSGRIKPINTMSSEVLRKISRKNKFNGLNSDQVILGMITAPDYWRSVQMIKISDPGLKKILGITGKYASFDQIVDMTSENGYKLGKYVEEANRKKPVERSKFDKDVLTVDERVNIFYFIYVGNYIRIFPLQNDPGHHWYSPTDGPPMFKGDDSLFVSNIMYLYTGAIYKAVASGDYTEADKHLESMRLFQERNAKDIIPSHTRINLEIKYNNWAIFERLRSYYGLFGFIFLIFYFVGLFMKKARFKWASTASVIVFLLAFFFHSLGLAMRWYIAGYAPWTNAYESMVFIGWASILAGLIFVRRAPVSLTATALLASLILMVAHLNWLNPEITSLVPVLKSYWLIIHVAVITSSYGFFALAAILGLMSLILMVLMTGKNRNDLMQNIKEFNLIGEVTLIIGLYLMTIGTFLGAVWANESWGRYWGWDPKETWALITVLVYSFITHMRHIPGFRGMFAFSFASLIGFSSVLMTYFGVNYYLSGLHSYAAGDPVPVPTFVYYTVFAVTVLSIIAAYRFRKLNTGEEL